MYKKYSKFGIAFFALFLLVIGALFFHTGLSKAWGQNDDCLKGIVQKGIHIPTDTWAKYTDQQNGYQFQFPARWELINYTDHLPHKIMLFALECVPSGQAYGTFGDIVVHLTAYPNQVISLDEWFHQNAELTPEKQQEIVDFMAENAADPAHAIQLFDIQTSYTHTTVSGLDAIVQIRKFLKPPYVEGGAPTFLTYYVKKGTTIYEIEASTPTSYEADALLNVFDKLVSTFKLL